MKRPLVPVALLYGGGLLIADWIQLPVSILFPLTFALALGCLFLRSIRHWLILPLILLTGWTNLVSRTAIISPYDLRCLVEDRSRIVNVRGTILETPFQRISIRDDKETWRSVAHLRLTHISDPATQDQWQPATGDIVATTPGVLGADCFAGQTVQINGVLSPPPEPLAEGLFDYRQYLRRQGVYYQLKVDSTNDWRVIGAPRAAPFADRFIGWAKRTLVRGLPEEDLSVQLLWAMTLGWKTGMTNEVYEPFMRSGTMHIFAISGLHIALIAGILVSLLRVAQIPRTWCGLIVVPLIWFYTAATGWQPSAIRSTVMMTVVIVGWALQRPSDLINSLAASALIILLWDPQQLFGASFQLSFFVVLSIALLVPPLEQLCDRWLQPDPLLPEELLPRWRRWLRVPLRWFTASLATSVAAWLGSLPLTAYYFHLLSPVTLLANLIMVPLSTLALASNLGSLLCGSWLGPLTVLFNHSAWWWMESMIQLSHWFTLLPKSYLYVKAPSWPAFIVYYTALIGTLSGWFFVKGRRLRLVGALALIASFCLWEWRSNNFAQLTVLPLNGGNAIYSYAPGRNPSLLIDSGPAIPAQFVTLPFLRAQGINQLPGVALTHGDIQHAGGVPLIAASFHVSEFFVSPVRFQSAPYNRLLSSLDPSLHRIQPIGRGNSIGPWMILHPEPEDNFARADDKPLVLRAEFDGIRVLLLSDLGREGQEELMRRTPDLRAEIVITGLPSQGEPVSDALLEATKPGVLVVVDSEFPAWERAKLPLRQRLKRQSGKVIYTRSTGAVTFTFRKRHWELRTMSGERLSGATSIKQE